MRACPSQFQQVLKCFADSPPTSVISLTLGERHKVPTAAEEERNHSATFLPTSRIALLWLMIIWSLAPGIFLTLWNWDRHISGCVWIRTRLQQPNPETVLSFSGGAFPVYTDLCKGQSSHRPKNGVQYTGRDNLYLWKSRILI